MTSNGTIDARAWLVWGAAASLPLLTGRHPVILLELLIIVVIVRSVCLPRREARGWAWLVRIATLAVPIGVLFNMLTVHAGDQRMFRIPDELPIVGGPVTWNAAVYGMLSGLTIVVLVGVGTTVAAAIEWSALIRLLPARAGSLAVAGSVAWSFLPQMARSWQEIRETQAARGHQWRGIRDFVPTMVPLLAGGLDRSIATAEALEARGFGVHATAASGRRGESLLTIGALTAAVAGLYLIAIGDALLAIGMLGVCAVMALVAVSLGRNSAQIRPTHYRRTTWKVHDTAVTAGAGIALAVTALALQVTPASLRYDPYPDLAIPQTQPWVILLLACLVVPAIVAPAPIETGSGP